MDGLLLCAKYAFAPNVLKYCGPSGIDELQGYLRDEFTDKGLYEYLSEFETLYPYLRFISKENNIKDPFDPRVVEAYWIGNELLQNISMKQFWDHLLDIQKFKKRFSPKVLKWIVGKIPQGALPHHSFHVFNVFHRTGHQAINHTLMTIDRCRIGWGKIIKIGKGTVTLNTQSVLYRHGKLFLLDGIKKDVTLPIFSQKKLQTGDMITYHWNIVCEVVTNIQIKHLERYTKWHLLLANQTI